MGKFIIILGGLIVLIGTIGLIYDLAVMSHKYKKNNSSSLIDKKDEFENEIAKKINNGKKRKSL